MARIRILARNIVDTATASASPAMSTTLPVTNLQRQTERARTARTTGLSSQDIKLTWSANQKANMLAVTRHNWSSSATLRTLGYSDAAWTTGNGLDTTALAAWSTSGLATDWDVYTEADFKGYRNSAQYFSEFTDVRSAIARIADGSNSDGYIEQTRLWMGKYFEFSYNPPGGGVDLELMDGSIAGRADDGSHIVDKRWKARQLTLNLENIPDADLPSVFAILRYLGLDRECFVSLYPGLGGAKEIYNQMACRVVQNPAIGPKTYGLHKTTVVFEET